MNFETLLKYWPILVLTLGIVSSASIAQWRIQDLESRMDDQSFTDPRVSELIQKQAVTETKLQAIHESLKQQQQHQQQQYQQQMQLQQQILNSILGQ